jgi:hypothetical protein
MTKVAFTNVVCNPINNVAKKTLGSPMSKNIAV